MEDCIFCKIVKGEVPCYKIYEDDFVLAFLDTAKDVYGHTLVIPKKHYQSVQTCDESTLSKVICACKKVGNHYVENCGFDGYNILNATGSAAQQSVFHLHFHVIPRKTEDGLDGFPHFKGCEDELGEVAETLKIPVKVAEKVDDENCVIVYTDGACSGNPGPGGWGVILSYKGNEKILSGGEVLTTNNRMELTAVIKGIEAVKKNLPIKVYSDSAYVVNAFHQNWVGAWQKSNWKNSSKDNVANKELWQELLALISSRDVEFVKVKGHADNEYNNRCDALARDEAAKLAKI